MTVETTTEPLVEQLKAARKRRGHSQVTAALEIGVAPGTFARWEQGAQRIRSIALRRACETYIARAEGADESG